MKSSLQSLSVFVFLALNIAASSAEPEKSESINDSARPSLDSVKMLKQTKRFLHKDFSVDCLVQSMEGRRSLVVRISRSGQPPAIKYKDVKVIAKDSNGKAIEMRSKDPEARIISFGDLRGRTAFLSFALNDSDDPVDVEVSYGGERPTFRLEDVK
jgi:hypothetical protein